jgi:hypothetical protein
MAKTKAKKVKKTAQDIIDPRPSSIDNERPRRVFLKKLRELAGAPGVEAAQAADRLGMTAAQFETLLREEAEAGQVWRHAKTDALVRAGKILWKLADDGNTAAARQILESLKQTVGGAGDTAALSVRSAAELVGETPDRLDYWYRAHAMPKNLDGTIALPRFLEWYKRFVVTQQTFDPLRVKLIELEPFLGVTRKTINEWLKDGLPRNADKSFSLPAVFAWRIQQLGSRTAPAAVSVNPLADKKAEKLQMEIDRARRRLIDREAVEMGLVARLGVMVQFLERKSRELPGLLAGHSAEDIKEELDKVFGQLKETAAAVPEDIAEALPAGRVEKLKTFLKEMKNEE